MSQPPPPPRSDGPTPAPGYWDEYGQWIDTSHAAAWAGQWQQTPDPYAGGGAPGYWDQHGQWIDTSHAGAWQGPWQQGPGPGPGGWEDPAFHGPPVLAQNASKVAEHLKRALAWDVSVVRITDTEKAALQSSGVEGTRVSALMAWRRSTLLIALPFVALTVIFSLLSNLTHDTTAYTGFGSFLLWLPFIGTSVLLVAVIYAVRRWTEPMMTSRFLVLGWLAAIALPLVAVLVPIDLQIQGIGDSTNPIAAEQALVLKLVFSLLLSLQVAGILLSVGGGLMRGASKAKNLFPSAIVPGWILIVLGPVYSLMVIAGLVSIYQTFGNAWLTIGLLVLAASPLTYILFRNTITRPMLAEQVPTAMTLPTRITGVLAWVGLVCIVMFAVTGEVGGYHFLGDVIGWQRAGMTVFDFVGRFLVTTVVFALVLTVLVYTEWQSLRASDPRARAEQSMHLRELQRYIGQNAPALNDLTGSLRMSDLQGMAAQAQQHGQANQHGQAIQHGQANPHGPAQQHGQGADQGRR